MSDDMSELRAVLAAYDLGELQASARDLRGTVNTSFFVDTIKDGRRSRYFLRRYKPTIQRDEIRFEHALIRHLTEQGECPVARVHATRDGSTVVERGGAFYALFDYLPGEDRYTWVRPRCPPAELRATGRLLAQFHSDVATFRPPGHREEPRILRLLTIISREWERACRLPGSDAYLRYALDHADEVRRRLAVTSAALRRAAAGLPTVINHSDYHPGNLKFEGARISGLVDFDWAKVDLRAFDVGLAIWYFCASWEGSADGRLRLGEVGAFLRGYQGRLREPAAIPPLSAAEMAALPDLIHAGSLYILYWGLRDYLSKPVDPDEYLIYLRHSINTTRWLARPENRRRLARTLRGLTRSARSVASTSARPAGHKPRAKRKSAPAGGKKVARRGQHARRVEP
jgi:homoserine kinase type II